MSKTVCAIAATALLCASVGCTNLTRTQQSTLSGGAIGAAGGAAISALAGGNAGVGALIGGAAGSIAGYLHAQTSHK